MAVCVCVRKSEREREGESEKEYVCVYDAARFVFVGVHPVLPAPVFHQCNPVNPIFSRD